MQDFRGVRRLVRFLPVVAAALIGQVWSAQAGDFASAEQSFARKSASDRIDLSVSLISTGHYSGIVNGAFNRRIDRGIRDFQAELGAEPTGILTEQQQVLLSARSSAFFHRIGLSEVPFSLPGTTVFVPLNLLGPRTVVSRGYAYEAWDGSVSVDLSSYASGEASLAELYTKFSREAKSRKVNYKVLREDFFVTSGTFNGREFYTRFQRGQGSTVGFTLAWDKDRIPEGGRIAVLMSNGLSSAAGTSLPSQDVAVQPAPPPKAVPDAPKSGATYSGSGFFIQTGKLVTNAHVVEGCESVALALGDKIGRGHILARDVANDLAIIETSFQSSQTASLRVGPRLGEDVSVFGFPLTGVLATSGNFTRGNITALDGMGDDSRFLQVSAPVQPGNSGGPLLDESGNVIGVVSSKIDAIKVAAATSDVPQNVNFAIKASTLESFLDSHAAVFSTGTLSAKLEPADIATRAQGMTAMIICRQGG